MESDTDRVMEAILPISAETIQAPIKAPTSPLNEQGDNVEHSFTTEFHVKKCMHPTEVLDAKVNKP